MRNIITVLALTLALTGCATIKNPLGTQQLAELESIYGVALGSMVAAKKLVCKGAQVSTAVSPCVPRAVIVQLQNANRVAYAQVIVVRNFVRNNPTLDASSAISVAMQEVMALRQIETINGIQ